MSTGAMTSLSVVAIPVFLDTTTHASQLYHEWARMYHYGHQILPGLAITTLMLYSYAALRNRAKKRPWAAYALAGVVTVSMIPFTWIFMVATNDTLFRLEAEGATSVAEGIEKAQELVKLWGWLHLARCLFPLAGAVLGLTTTFHDRQ